MTNQNIQLEKHQNQPNQSDFLYRYVTIDKLMDFLINSRIPLVRLNKFQDKLEGVNIKHLLLNYSSREAAKYNIPEWFAKISKSVLENININPTKRNSLKRERESFQMNNFANCWYISDHESVAMWNLYSRPDSVAIKISYQALIEELNNRSFTIKSLRSKILKYGCVDYYRFNNIDELTKIDFDIKKSIGFIKDFSFNHEKEFRIILQTEEIEQKAIERKELILDEQIEKLNKNMNPEVIPLAFSNFKQMPFELIFHPQSTNWHKENVKQLMNRLNLPFNTFDSELFDIFN